ncbi:EexN family lipoprotein [[Pasteurella] aerogenes]
MKIIYAMLLGLFLTACEEVKTLEYYKNHEADRLKVIEECDKKGKPVSSGPNCRNAYDAQAKIRRTNSRGAVFSK